MCPPHPTQQWTRDPKTPGHLLGVLALCHTGDPQGLAGRDRHTRVHIMGGFLEEQARVGGSVTLGWQEKEAELLMEFYAITSTWVCVCVGGHSKEQKPLRTGGLVTGSTEARRGGKGRGGPTPLACLPARSEDQTWWGPRGGGPWAHGHPPTAGPFLPLLGLACTPRGAQKQERPPTRRGGVSSGAPAQSKVRDSGGVPHPPACPESSRSEIRCWQGCAPLRLLQLSAPLVPSACGPVTAACDSDSVVPWGRRVHDCGRRGLVRWASVVEPPP